MEWNTAFAGMSFQGHRGCAAGWDWLFDVAEDYRVTLVEVTDLGGDRVLAEVDRALKGKGSEIEVSAPMFSVVTLRDGLVARMDEYSSPRRSARGGADLLRRCSPAHEPVGHPEHDALVDRLEPEHVRRT